MPFTNGCYLDFPMEVQLVRERDMLTCCMRLESIHIVMLRLESINIVTGLASNCCIYVSITFPYKLKRNMLSSFSEVNKKVVSNLPEKERWLCNKDFAYPRMFQCCWMRFWNQLRMTPKIMYLLCGRNLYLLYRFFGFTPQ